MSNDTEILNLDESIFRTVAEKLDAAVAIHELIRDSAGNPVDYIFLYANPSFYRHTGLKSSEVIGKKVTQCLPDIANTGLIKSYGKVVDYGESINFDLYYEGLNRYYSVNAFVLEENRFATIFNDITEKHLLEQEHEKDKLQLENLINQRTEELRKEQQLLKQAHSGLQRQTAYNEALFDAASDIIFFKDIDGVYLGCNLGFAVFAGRQRDNIIGFTDHDFFSKSVADEFRRNDRLMMEQGQARHNEEWITYPDGHKILLDTLKTPLRDNNGRLLGILGISRDITVRKQTEEHLRESETNFRRFFESMNDMIIVAEHSGKMVYVNNALSQKLGYTKAELLKKNILDLHDEKDKKEALRIVDAMLHNKTDHCPLPLRRSNGTLLPVETRVWLSRWDGKDCLFSISKDMTTELEAKQRFERLFHHHPFPMALKSVSDLRFEDVNDAFLSLLGYSREEVIGHTTDELNMFPDTEKHVLAISQLKKDGFIREHELKLRSEDGSFFDVLLTAERIENQGKNYFLLIMQDVTERNMVNSEMARLSRIQRTLMRLATEFINVPPDHQDAAVNQALETMGRLIRADRAYLMSYDFEAGLIHNTHEWCGENTEPQIDNLQDLPMSLVPEWVEAHRRGEKTHIESVMDLPPDDHLRNILEPQDIQSLITLPLMGDTQCLGFVGFDAVHHLRKWTDEEISLLRVLAEIFANFETRRILHNQLKEAHDQAQSAARAKTVFLGNMSHEIRTPLNAILGYAQIMERQCLDSETEKYMKGLTRSGNHLLELINDVLELARSDGQEILISSSNTDFQRLIEDVHMMASRRSKARSLSIEVNCEPNMPRWIVTDAGKVRQVLMNLVDNAIKYTEQGSIRLVASLAEKNEDGSVLMAVEVADTGCGIQPDDQQKIFELFSQADHINPAKGVGLGLTICRRYATALGGDVTVKSNPGVGSRFRFTFTTKLCSGDGCEPGSEQTLRHFASGQPSFRILVVDDDTANRDILADMLRSVGFIVDMCASGEETLERLEAPDKPEFDLLLLDKQMPGIDGYETVRKLRKYPDVKDIKVIIVTASGFKDESIAAQDCGADGFVPKPVRLNYLLDEIKKVCGITYEEQTDNQNTPDLISDQENELFTLPAETVNQLLSAAEQGDIRTLRYIIDELADSNKAAAYSLRSYVDRYDYTGLRQEIQKTSGEG